MLDRRYKYLLFQTIALTLFQFNKNGTLIYKYFNLKSLNNAVQT